LKDQQLENGRIIKARGSGLLNCVILYFELMLAPNRSFSTHPSAVDQSNHWLNPVYVFVNPHPLQTGDKISLKYKYKVVDKGTWIDVSW
jgi:hypothetical protein